MRFRYLLNAIGKSMQTPLGFYLMEYFYASHANIIYYHGVWDDDERGRKLKSLFGGVHTRQLKSELQLLQRFFDIVPLGELLTEDPKVKTSCRPRIAVTFDDGFDLVGSGAAAALSELDISATALICQKSIGNNAILWDHALRAAFATLNARNNSKFDRDGFRQFLRQVELLQPKSKAKLIQEYCGKALDTSIEIILREFRPYLTWHGVDQWMAMGHSVGAHTYSHVDCSQLKADELFEEIVAPIEHLCIRYNLRSAPFSYPFGRQPAQDVQRQLFSQSKISCILQIGNLTPLHKSGTVLGRFSGENGLAIGFFAASLRQRLKST